jgi:hypothetical protein
MGNTVRPMRKLRTGVVSESTTKTVVRLVLATLFSLTLSIWTFELILRNTFYIRNSSSVLISIALAFATVAMPFAIAVHAARAAFRRRAALEGLLVIFTGYMAVLISFAGIYYSFNVVSDYHEARDRADFYVHAASHLDDGSLRQVPERVRKENAFIGMRHSTWTDLADEARPAFWHPSAKVSEDFLLEAARRYGPWRQDVSKDKRGFRPRFKGEERLPSLLQCLHFSVVTMATVGYGDVNPNQWYSQLAVDMQILIGQILVVFALGCVLGRWWD